MDALSGKGSLLKISSKGEKFLSKLESKKRKMSSGQGTEDKLVSASAFMKYKNALKETAPITVSMPRAFEMTTQAFKEDPSTSKSPFLIAQTAINTLKNSMTPAGAEQKMLWNLVKGPIDFQWAYARMQTGCKLQQIWEDKVLVEVLGISDQEELINALMGTNGFAKKYVEVTAEPFIGRSARKGYYPKKVEGLDGNVEFSDEFLVFITKGAKAAKPVKDSYRVTIKGLPTDVNREARVKPHATFLSLQCGGANQTMMNLNFPVRKIFTWSPEDCSDVIFKIEVGNLVLTKEYTGYRAFPRFLQDFQKGYRVFFRKYFKESEAALKRLGIKYIKVKYKLTGHKPVIKLVPDMPGNVPEDIVKCWE
jgi:type VI secretion system protein ImpL